MEENLKTSIFNPKDKLNESHVPMFCNIIFQLYSILFVFFRYIALHDEFLCDP